MSSLQTSSSQTSEYTHSISISKGGLHLPLERRPLPGKYGVEGLGWAGLLGRLLLPQTRGHQHQVLKAGSLQCLVSNPIHALPQLHVGSTQDLLCIEPVRHVGSILSLLNAFS